MQVSLQVSQGSDKGRRAPRGSGSTAGSSSSSAAEPLGPVGRAPAPNTEFVATDEWYPQYYQDVESATEVELASYMYDNPSVQAVLERRLKGRRPFHPNVFVDAAMFDGKIPLWSIASVFILEVPISQGGA